MPYHPKKEDIEYLQNLREKNKATLKRRLTTESSMILLMSIPIEVEAQIQDRLGANWFNDEKKVIQFMRENPQYTIARPL